MHLWTAIFTALAFLSAVPSRTYEVQTASDDLVIATLPGYAPTAGQPADPRCGHGRCEDVCVKIPAGASIQQVRLDARKVGAKDWGSCRLDVAKQIWRCAPDARFEWFPGRFETRPHGIFLSVCMQARNLDSATREGRLSVTWSTHRHQ